MSNITPAKGNVVSLLFQRGPNKPSKQETPTVMATELYRLLGQLETASKQTTGAVDTLTRSMAENNVVTAQIKASLDNISSGHDAVKKTADDAHTIATAAHARLDRIMWTALGGGSVAGAIIGFFSDRIATAWGHITAVLP